MDVATASESAMVQKSFDNNDIRTFSQIANTTGTEIVARKDRGIEKLSDLKGKRVGLQRGSSSEFYLGGFLKSSNIPLSKVEIVNLGPAAAGKALYEGTVDAVVIWEPYVSRIKERLGKNVTSWPVQGRDDYYFLLITKEAFLRRSPQTVENMLRALIDAEDFAAKHPEEALRIIDARVRSWQGDPRPLLAKSKLKVGLDQGLLTLMEAEANWMIRNNLTKKKEMPNYLDMIDLKPLEKVKPDAVRIIH
ncbi:MAG: ABC transporter substrate-binding protein [Syntrophales bacterium LBB04]|nr:ABC transporter substrate-binding protein [Syntrophales bacterium LBB04]